MRMPSDPSAITFIQAQHRAIKYHAWATGVNAGSLALGIILVFFGAEIHTYLVGAGIGLVAVGIAGYLVLASIATRYDKLAVALAPAFDYAAVIQPLQSIIETLQSIAFRLEALANAPTVGGGAGSGFARPLLLKMEKDQIRIVYEKE